jgi:hypothetical protein
VKRKEIEKERKREGRYGERETKRVKEREERRKEHER